MSPVAEPLFFPEPALASWLLAQRNEGNTTPKRGRIIIIELIDVAAAF